MHVSHFSSAFKSLPFFAISLIFATFVTPTIGLPSSYHAQELSVVGRPKLPLPIEVIYEFPQGYWCENLAIRGNGQILATITTRPELYLVDPKKERDAIRLYSFPATSVIGIVELGADVFYVATGNVTLSSTGVPSVTPGSSTVWEVDMRSFSVRDGRPARVSKIAVFPDAGNLNGLAVLNRRKRLLLGADSLGGRIWQLNVSTKQIKIFSEDPLTKPAPDSNLPVGINGIRVREGAVYFSNTGREIIARLNVKYLETPIGSAVAVVTGLSGMDDFAIGPNGAFFSAQNLNDSLSYAPASGGPAEFIANITANPTSVVFGRRREDSQSVYISCAGGTSEEFNSPSPPRGKILRVDVKAFL